MNASDDLISRQGLLRTLNKYRIEKLLEGKDISLVWECIDKVLQEPSAQSERLTDDDFETIRIHLNAYKEGLWNQGRLEEAEDYQRIINRFMSFTSAQPERKTGRWIYGEDEYGIDGYHCDKCGFFVPWDYTHTFINYIEDYKYCPNCGTDMKGGKNGRTEI